MIAKKIIKGINCCKNPLKNEFSSGSSPFISTPFAISLETTEGLAAQLLKCVQRGFEISWLDEFPAKVNALTLGEVNAAIKKHLDPERMVTIKAGTLK